MADRVFRIGATVYGTGGARVGRIRAYDARGDYLSVRASVLSRMDLRIPASAVRRIDAEGNVHLGLGPDEMAETAPAADTVAPLDHPILPHGQDPHVVRHGGLYYLAQSLDDRAITIAATTALTGLAAARPAVVWGAPPSGSGSHGVWAPELVMLEGRWYIYYAADDDDNASHRMYALASVSGSPLGPYQERGRVATRPDTWAIDGTVLAQGDAYHFIWSGWPGADDVQQNLYIAPMRDPCTLAGPGMTLSEPAYAWERPTVGPAVNEGPAVLRHGERLFLAYSANGSWTDDYCLGLLTYLGGDVADPLSWAKAARPAFASDPRAGLYGPGHNSFTTSHDGAEDWMVYHANTAPGLGWAGRGVWAQRFGWRPDGRPDFGAPRRPADDWHTVGVSPVAAR